MKERNSKIFFIVIMIATIIGIGISIHLVDIDYNVKFNENYTPNCDINKAVSCSKVAEHETAYIYDIPVASLGVMGYLLLLAYMIINRKKKYLYNNLFIFFSIFSVVSLYYFYLSKFVIHAICMYCYGTYIINWLVNILLFFIVFKLQEEKFSAKDLFKVGKLDIALYLFIAIALLVPSKIYFSHEITKFSYKNGFFDKKEMVGIAGDPNGSVTLVLYSDYECPYCARFESSIKEALKNFTNLKLVRKEFPLDNECNPILGKRKFHEDACKAAFFAKCAGKQDKFWETADYLHHHRKDLTKDDLVSYIDKLKLDREKMLKCIDSKEIKDEIKKNILEGVKLKVRGTPAFIINGKFNSGAYKYKKLEKILIKAGGKLDPKVLEERAKESKKEKKGLTKKENDSKKVK